jgi:hypothetical protein
MILRGIAHAHSRYSYDGCHDLAALANFARARRLDFVLMSEHNRTLTDATMAAFVAECASLSEATGVLMVPGIECEATPDFVHVLGYGARSLVRDRGMAAIIAGLRNAGAFTVLAHPIYKRALDQVGRPALAALDGFEIWNGKADGGRYPSDAAIRELAELHHTRPALRPMAGVDLHRLEAYAAITLDVTCAARTAGEILTALRRGAYRMRGGAFSHAATDPLRVPRRSPRRLAAAAALDVARKARRLNAWLARRGVATPAPLAHAARRILK